MPAQPGQPPEDIGKGQGCAHPQRQGYDLPHVQHGLILSRDQAQVFPFLRHGETTGEGVAFVQDAFIRDDINRNILPPAQQGLGVGQRYPGLVVHIGAILEDPERW